jgi:HSP20 family molecular chaperone IbpA
MATTKPALSGKTTPAVAPKIISDSNEREAFDQMVQRKVAERAYQLFEGSNAAHGKDQEHWLQAESEILQHGLDVRESGSWLSITASLPDVSGDNLQICLEPNRAVVHGQKISEQRDASSGTQSYSQEDFFLHSDLNVEVDPSTASASLKDQKLTVMVKKRYPSGSPSNASVRTGE